MKRILISSLIIIILLTACTPDLEPGGNFSNKNISNISSPNTDLQNIDFSESELNHIDFSSADLTNANFTDAELDAVNLSNAVLQDVDLSSAHGTDIDFSDADLSGANLSGADLHGVDLSAAILADADLREAKMENCIGLTNDMLSSVAWQSSENILAAFNHSCKGGGGVSQAAAYNPSAISPLIVIASGGENEEDVSTYLPSSWISTAINQTELVVCIHYEESILLETCTYADGPDIERYQQKYNVAVQHALTGELIAEEIFLGMLPRECMTTERYDITSLSGGIDFAPIIEWLRQFVEP